MIALTQLSGKNFWLNPHQIESMDQRPDTTLLMLSGKHVIVLEKPDVIIQKIVDYRALIGAFKNEE